MNTSKFWPLDYDTDGEIYENVAWDLPGLRPHRHKSGKARVLEPRKPRRRLSAIDSN
jgi:hypothetical protein